MRPVEILKKKRDGLELSRGEIGFLVRGFSSGSIPDSQVSAFLMAVYFRGMTEREMVALTDEMRQSGSILDLSEFSARKVDKHSTGGIGDKTSLIVAPALAAAGLMVPMISGRGLAHTGGTLDKLESIPGFQVRLDPQSFRKSLRATGAAMAGPSDDLVPADRKLYALRDVTATVESHALIASSIMSKKLAEGIDALVLDIKTGSGAFIKEREEAERLARAMVGIGRAFGKKVVALITDMSQPLGEYAGNALEVMECLEVLKGRGPQDVVTLCRELSAYALLAAGVVREAAEGRKVYDDVIRSGEALEKFRAIIRQQRGNADVVDDYGLLPRARFRQAVNSPGKGFVRAIDAEKAGWAVNILGAGRERVDSAVDPAVGMQTHKKTADPVERGEPLCTLHYNDPQRFEAARRLLADCYSLTDHPPSPPALILKVIRGDGNPEGAGAPVT